MSLLFDADQNVFFSDGKAAVTIDGKPLDVVSVRLSGALIDGKPVVEIPSEEFPTAHETAHDRSD